MRDRTRVRIFFVATLLALLGHAVQSWGQEQPRRVGVLTFISIADDPTLTLWMKPFRRALADEGWIEGKNVTFEYRSAQGDPSQLAQAASDLVQRKVDVIWASGAPLVRAAHLATQSVPIVAMDFTTDPVAEGYAESYGRPGRNLTGVFLDAPEFTGKWLQTLRAIVPQLSRVAVLWDSSPGSTHLQAAKATAASLGIQLQVIEVRTPLDIEKAFSTLRGHPQALMLLPSPMMYTQSVQLAKLAKGHRLPATSMAPAFAAAGGLVSYGPDQTSTNELSALFVAKVLSGMKPADMPVQRPSTFKLIVNLKAAKALGLTIPDSVLYRADELIQ